MLEVVVVSELVCFLVCEDRFRLFVVILCVLILMVLVFWWMFLMMLFSCLCMLVILKSRLWLLLVWVLICIVRLLLVMCVVMVIVQVGLLLRLLVMWWMMVSIISEISLLIIIRILSNLNRLEWNWVCILERNMFVMMNQFQVLLCIIQFIFGVWLLLLVLGRWFMYCMKLCCFFWLIFIILM